MFTRSRRPHIPLPEGWTTSVKSAVIHTIALAHYAVVFTRSWAANCPIARVRLKAELDRANQEIIDLREEMRIKDARMASISPHCRPQYPPAERMAILELKAARGWSLKQTAKAFLVTPATISSWMKLLDEEGPDALVQLHRPVNKFPDYVQYVVQRLKKLCPTLSKVKIARTLARAGLHLGTTSVGRFVKHKPQPPFVGQAANLSHISEKPRIVTAKRPNHVWHINLTVVPTGAGFWIPWMPFSLPQCWLFCWWVAVAVDHFSRRAVAVAAFDKQPTSQDVRCFLGRTIGKTNRTPKYIVCDRGVQFDCKSFRNWCRRKGIKPPRYGAIGKHGSIAVVERFILTLKTLLACLMLVPYRQDKFRQELSAIVEWYNQHRPHEYLDGKTPNEAYYGWFPANRKPRHEPRSHWPRGSPCAIPWALGARQSRREADVGGPLLPWTEAPLPIIKLRRAA